MSELQESVVHEVLVPLERAKAELLDKRIRMTAESARNNLESVARLLEEAEAGQVHLTLGFKSWTGYVADALGGQLELSADGRKAVVELMAGQGMSVRAIAGATGVSKSTVSNDLAEVSNHWTPQKDSADAGVQTLDTSPEPDAVITGIDGKTYTKPKQKPKPKGDKPVPKRGPNVRKRFERMAIQVGGWTNDLKDMDPVELVVDREVQKGIDYTIEGVAAIRGFLDRVTPVRPRPVPTVLRGKVAELGSTIGALRELASDPRWMKACKRFSDKDRAALDTHIVALQELRVAMDAPVPAIEADTSEVAI